MAMHKYKGTLKQPYDNLDARFAGEEALLKVGDEQYCKQCRSRKMTRK